MFAAANCSSFSPIWMNVEGFMSSVQFVCRAANTILSVFLTLSQSFTSLAETAIQDMVML